MLNLLAGYNGDVMYGYAD